jgi:hypothetical protein
MRSLIFINILMFAVFGVFAQSDDQRKITIPVIFHVIYTDNNPDNGMSESVRNSDNGNSTSKLTREKILAELQDLDQDFQMTNPDLTEVIDEYKSAIGNPRIHFVLKNIIYTPTNLREIHQRNNSKKLHELSPPQNPEACLNVYISNLRVKGHGSEGVTNVPSTRIDLTDDFVNLNFSWVGLHYRLLSHEVGHWLGLWHVDDENQLTLDKINDIPVQTDLTQIICVICVNPNVEVISRQRG